MHRTIRSLRTRRVSAIHTAVAGGTFLWAVDQTGSDGSWLPLRHDVEPASSADRLASRIAVRYQVTRPRHGRRRVRVWTWLSALAPTEDELVKHASDFPADAEINTPDDGGQ